MRRKIRGEVEGREGGRKNPKNWRAKTRKSGKTSLGLVNPKQSRTLFWEEYAPLDSASHMDGSWPFFTSELLNFMNLPSKSNNN